MHTINALSPRERRALLKRAAAAHRIIRNNTRLNEGERLSLLAAVVWPTDEIWQRLDVDDDDDEDERAA